MKEHAIYTPDDRHVPLRTTCGRDVLPGLNTANVRKTNITHKNWPHSKACHDCWKALYAVREELRDGPYLMAWALPNYHYTLEAGTHG